MIYPPNHFQCRSGVIALSQEQLADVGAELLHSTPNELKKINKALGIFNTNPALNYLQKLEKSVTLKEKRIDILLGRAAGTIYDPSKTPTTDNVKYIMTLKDVSHDRVLKLFDRYENIIVTLDHEVEIVVLPDGRVFRIEGNVNTVNAGDSLKNFFKDDNFSLENAWSLHNHTDSETSFSFSRQDLYSFKQEKIFYARGVDYKFIYEMVDSNNPLVVADDIDIPFIILQEKAVSGDRLAQENLTGLAAHIDILQRSALPATSVNYRRYLRKVVIDG
jgi:hypothetical protein